MPFIIYTSHVPAERRADAMGNAAFGITANPLELVQLVARAARRWS